MASLNQVNLIGNLGRDPEMRYTSAGTPVCTLSIATTQQWTDDEGNRKERTEWHRVVLWKKLAEVASTYLKRGDPVYIGGALQTRKWEKDGADHYSTEVVADSLQLLASRSRTDTDADAGAPEETAPAPSMIQGKKRRNT